MTGGLVRERWLTLQSHRVINPESPIAKWLPQVSTGTVYKDGLHRRTLQTTSIRRTS